jgi:hypothetical protein
MVVRVYQENLLINLTKKKFGSRFLSILTILLKFETKKFFFEKLKQIFDSKIFGRKIFGLKNLGSKI